VWKVKTKVFLFEDSPSVLGFKKEKKKKKILYPISWSKSVIKCDHFFLRKGSEWSGELVCDDTSGWSHDMVCDDESNDEMV